MNADSSKKEGSNRDRISEILFRVMATPPGTSAYIESLIEAGESLVPFDGALALRMNKEACDMAESLRDGALFAKALYKYAWRVAQQGDIETALIRASHSRAVAESLGDLTLLCGAKYVIAWIRTQAADYRSAINMWRDLVQTAQAIGDPERESNYQTELGFDYMLNGERSNAIAAQMAAHSLMLQTAPEASADTANNVANAMLAAGRHADSKAWALQALDWCPADDAHTRSYIEHTLGSSELAAGDYDSACRWFIRARESMGDEQSDMRLGAEIALGCGDVARLLNETPECIGHYERALALAQHGKNLDLVTRAHIGLKTIYNTIGAFEEALSHCASNTKALHKREASATEFRVGVMRAQDALVGLRGVWTRDVFSRGYL